MPDFFTESELEKIYGSDFAEISPTDQPLSSYRAGSGKCSCKECGNVLDVVCDAVFISSAQGLSDHAYCEGCEIRFERKRQIMKKHKIDYQYDKNRSDELEEYTCQHCGEEHPFSEVAGNFEYIKKPKISTQDGLMINCPCGEWSYVESRTIPTSISCKNCSRTFEFGYTRV